MKKRAPRPAGCPSNFLTCYNPTPTRPEASPASFPLPSFSPRASAVSVSAAVPAWPQAAGCAAACARLPEEAFVAAELASPRACFLPVERAQDDSSEDEPAQSDCWVDSA